MLDSQKKQIQQVNGVNTRSDLKVIGNLLNYTFYELLNKEKIVTMTRWYDSVRSRIQALRVLVKLYDEIESGRFHANTDIKTEKNIILTNKDLCIGMNMR
jgi:hypothetical protein